MSEFLELTEDRYKEIIKTAPESIRRLSKFIHDKRVCSISDIMSGFPDVGDTPEAMLKAIGKANDVLYRKFNIVIAPISIVEDTAKCTFALRTF